MDKYIDVDFDFTTDTPGYWDEFWKNNHLRGNTGLDPDVYSKTLRKYHEILWSKKLPNGEFLELKQGALPSCYLCWKNYRFGSDSIITSFRYKKMQKLMYELDAKIYNFQNFIADFLKKTCTIGGFLIFPIRPQSINQCRGTNRKISDRIDLTLECIRKYYQNEPSPLFETLRKDADFFALFVDFKGYIEFFYLQDLVFEGYNSVKFFLGEGDFEKGALPRTIEDWLIWHDKSVEFTERRNKRIAESLREDNFR